MARIDTQLRTKDGVLAQAWTQLARIINYFAVQVEAKPASGDVPTWDGEKWVPAPGGGGGSVTAVTATSPLSSSGGTTPNIDGNYHGTHPDVSKQIQLSDGSGTTGHMAVFDSGGNLTNGALPASGTVTNVTATAPITSTGGATPNIDAAYHGNSPHIQLSDNTGTTGHLAVYDANGNVTDGGVPAAGSVTSVGLTMPAEFNVSGSPVTTSGTLAVTKANENANYLYVGPASGAAAAPTFRAAVVADYPFHDESLCDGFGNFVFDGTGDVITVVGIPN